MVENIVNINLALEDKSDRYQNKIIMSGEYNQKENLKGLSIGLNISVYLISSDIDLNKR